MKWINQFFILLFLASLGATKLYGCPTCIGRIEKNSPPFFSDEQYQPSNYQNDHIASDQEETKLQENERENDDIFDENQDGYDHE